MVFYRSKVSGMEGDSVIETLRLKQVVDPLKVCIDCGHRGRGMWCPRCYPNGYRPFGYKGHLKMVEARK